MKQVYSFLAIILFTSLNAQIKGTVKNNKGESLAFMFLLKIRRD